MPVRCPWTVIKGYSSFEQGANSPMTDGDLCLRISAWSCFGVMFLTGVILFSVAFDTIDPWQVGIKYNNNLKEIDEHKVYANGRYFVGLGLHFIKFPITAAPIGWVAEGGRVASEGGPMSAWTREGQELVTEVTMTLRLDRRFIIDIYKRYATDYIDPIRKMIENVLKDTSTNYEAEDFFTQREAIGRVMFAAVRTRLAQEHMYCDYFQLQSIDLPDAFESKVVQKVVTAQIRQTRGYQNTTAVLRSEVDIKLGTAYAQGNLTVTRAIAESNRDIDKARSSAYKQLRDQETSSYQNLSAVLGFTSPSALLKYRYAQVIANTGDDSCDSDGGCKKQNKKFVIGFNAPVISVAGT